MGRVKKFKKYRNYFSKGVLYTESRTVNLSKTKIKDVINRERGLPADFNNNLPLPVNSVSKIIGSYSGRALHNKYVPNYEPKYDVRDILTASSSRFRDYISGKGAKVLPGSWRFSMINLERMASEVENYYTIDQLLAGLKSRVGIDFVLPRVGKYDHRSILGLSVNPKANSGLWTGEYCGRVRRVSTNFTKYAAWSHAVRIMKSDKPVLDTSLVKLGGREKRNLFDISDGHKIAKARLTFGQEDVPTLIGQSVAKHFNEALQILSEGFNWGGRINGRQKFFKLFDGMLCDRNSTDINTHTDFSGHDNDVVEESIVTAFGIIYACFDENPQLRNLFYYIMSGMIFKRVVLPESNLIYQITKGVMSGHAFTSILTTLCAYMTISTSIQLTTPKSTIKRSYLQGAGDDWIIKICKSVRNIVHFYINKYSSNTCDEFHSNSGYIDNDNPYEYTPTFLKKQYINGFIGWNESELFTNLSFPTSTKMKLRKRIMDYIVMCVSGPFNSRITNCCKKLIINAILDKYTEQRGTDSSKSKYYHEVYSKVYYYLIHSNDIDYIMSHVPEDFNHDIMLMYGHCTILNLRSMMQYWIDELDRRVYKSSVWMLRPTHFIRHERVHRLKVFDLNKKYIDYDILFDRRNYIARLYMHNVRYDSSIIY